MKSLKNRSVVITGAASGIGRATAIRFAKSGARLGLIDINLEGLGTLEEEIKVLNTQSIAITVDVADLPSLEKAADKIASSFGKIDVWVNNAGIAVYGEFQDIPPGDFKRVLEVTFLGQVNGTRVAMPYLEHPDSEGILLGNISILGEVTAPVQTPYASSKFALTGFYSSLHEELLYRKSPMKVGTVLPSSVATPFFSHAKTFLGVEPRPYPPTYSPELVADKIFHLAFDPKLGVVAGSSGKTFIKIYRRFPKLFHSIQSRIGYAFQRSSLPKAPDDTNNLKQGISEPGQKVDSNYKYIPYFVSKTYKPFLLISFLSLSKILFDRRKEVGSG